jgi:arsenate-mycothiol transferase
VTDAAEATLRPSVLFVCVKNAGKSQMAEALMRSIANGRLDVHSAGTQPAEAINDLAADAVAEVGTDMRTGSAKAIDPDLLRTVDRVVVLGEDAVVEPVPGMRGTVERWVTDEPSERGIEGLARTRLVRDDIAARCRALLAELVRR